MGASSSVEKRGRSSKKSRGQQSSDGSPLSKTPPQPAFELPGFQPTSPKKKGGSNSDAMQSPPPPPPPPSSHHRGHRRSKERSKGTKARNIERLNASAPITSPSRAAHPNAALEHTVSSFNPNQMESLQNALRASSAPPGQEQASHYEMSDTDFIDSLAPRSPYELQRVPELEVENFRRLVTSVNMKVDKTLQKTLSRRMKSVRMNAARPAAAAAREGNMDWLEKNIPYVTERKPSMQFSQVSGAGGYPYLDDLMGPANPARNVSNPVPTNAGGHDSSSLMGSVSASTSDEEEGEDEDDGYTKALAAVQMPPEAASRHSYPTPESMNHSTPATSHTVADTPYHYGTSVTRKGTFGLLMPIGQSVVISRRGMASFRNGGQRRISNDTTGSGGHATSNDDYVDHFLMARCASDSDESPIKAGTAAPENTVELNFDYDFLLAAPPVKPAAAPRPQPRPQQQQQQQQQKQPQKPPPQPTPWPLPPLAARAAPARAASPRRYPLPQPLLYGPRSYLRRSRPFNVRQVLGYDATTARRVPSPDWDRLHEEHGTPPPRFSSPNQPRIARFY